MSAQPARSAGAARDKTTEGLSLGQLAVRGGGYLIGREAVGMLVRLVGVVVVVRLVGPSQFGIYSAAAAFSLFAASFAQMGLEVYLIRLGSALRPRHFDQAFSLLLVSSLGVTGVAEALTFAMGGLLRPIGVLVPLRVLLLCTPINVLWAPAQAAIERRFNYRAMGLIELGGDVVLYATAIPLALAHHGAWSLVIGFFAWQSWLLVTSMVAWGHRPRWDWSWPEVRDFGRHGLGFSSSDWLRRAGDLVNPLVVGTFFGATGVGYVAFALRLVDTVGFAKRSAYRLGLVAMSRVDRDDTVRLRYSIEEGSLLQFLALAVPFAAFGVVARWVVPVAFGGSWTHALSVYSLLALAAVLGACGFVQSTFMYSRGRNVLVALTVAARDVVLAVGAVVLVKAAGLDGFGLASVIALVSLVVMDRALRKTIPFSYAKVLPWVVVLCPPVLFPMLPLPWAFVLLAPCALVVLPTYRAELARLYALVRAAVARQEPAGQRAVEEVADRSGAADRVDDHRFGPAQRRRELSSLPGGTLGLFDAAFAPDELTGLPALTHFVAELAPALAAVRPGHETVGVMLVELVPGEARGRAVTAELKAVAARLTDRLRDRDLVARVGPHLFAVLVRLPYAVDLEALRSRVLRELQVAVPPRAGGPSVRVALVSATRGGPTEVESLLRTAVEALKGTCRDEPPHRQWQLAAVGASPSPGWSSRPGRPSRESVAFELSGTPPRGVGR